MKFGEFLKTEREDRNWTQPQAAEAIGIEQSYLSKLENNKAIPSAEIFDQLMATYEFDLHKIAEKVSQSELSKFKEIVLIRDFIIKQRHTSTGERRKWLKIGLVALMLGSGLMSIGFVLQHEVESLNYSYRYESKGLIKVGESRYLYMHMPSYRDFSLMAVNEHLSQNYRKDPLFERLDYKIEVSAKHLGEFFDSKEPEVSRRYKLTDINRDPVDKSRYWIIFSFGVMLLVGGITSLNISKRW